MNVAGLVLAAGASRRMGTPKALLQYRGQTFLDGLIAKFQKPCSSVFVVLGHHAEAIRAGARLIGTAQIVINEHPERGMLSSWQCGLRRIAEYDPGFNAVLVSPVDFPAVDDATVAEIVAGVAKAEISIPQFGGEHGHPICFRMSIASELLALEPEAQARDVVRRHRDRTHYVETRDAGILRDVDDMAGYRSLLESA